MQQQQICGAVPLHPRVVLMLGQRCLVLLSRVFLGKRTRGGSIWWYSCPSRVGSSPSCSHFGQNTLGKKLHVRPSTDHSSASCRVQVLAGEHFLLEYWGVTCFQSRAATGQPGCALALDAVFHFIFHTSSDGSGQCMVDPLLQVQQVIHTLVVTAIHITAQERLLGL